MTAWFLPTIALALVAFAPFEAPANPPAGTLPEPVPCPPKPYQMGRHVHRPRSPGSKAKRRWKRSRRGGA